MYLLHILLGSFINLYNHSMECSCHHNGGGRLSLEKNQTRPLQYHSDNECSIHPNDGMSISLALELSFLSIANLDLLHLLHQL